ncbi:unnamed protein product [Gadus morhua 'NCC']
MPESDLVHMLKPLDKRFWPQDRNALILYGEKEIRALAKTLGESASEAVQEFRDWKLQDDAPGETLQKLSIASRTYLPTSSECERGFSAVNDTDRVLWLAVEAGQSSEVPVSCTIWANGSTVHLA